MRWKAVLTLLLLLFAPATTLVAFGFSSPALSELGITQNPVDDPGCDPMGDPVEGPGYPG